MKISARNTLKGKVKQIEDGAVNTEVTIELPGGLERVAQVRAAARVEGDYSRPAGASISNGSRASAARPAARSVTTTIAS